MPNPNHEVRSIAEDVRMIEVDGRQMIRGYAAVFNTPSQVMTTDSGKQFREIIRPGAFSKSLQGADVRALYNHNPDLLLGRRSSGTLRLREDDRGLAYEIDPPTEAPGPTVKEGLTRRDITGSSFSFATIEDAWSTDDDGIPLRELRAVHVFDVGPVVFPAYLDATAAFRSLDAHEESRAITVVVPPPSDARVMIGLWIPPETASGLAIKGGEPAESLHLTLCYLGRAIEVGTNTIEQVKLICQEIACYNPVILGMVNGVGRFSASETSDGKDVIVGLADIPGLTEFRTQLACRLEANGIAYSKTHGFIPHITLSYVDTGAKSPVVRIPPTQLAFANLCLVVNEEKMCYPFGDRTIGYRDFKPSPDQVAALLRIRLSELS